MLTRRTLLTGLSALTSLALGRRSEAVGSMDMTLDLANLVNRAHPLAHQLGWWWLTLPQLHGGKADWVDLMRHRRGVPTGMSATMSATSGYSKTTTRPGGFGHVSCDGTDDKISVADNDMYTFVGGGQDLPFSLTGWFWLTTVARTEGLVVKGDQQEWALWKASNSSLVFECDNGAQYIQVTVTMTTALYQAQWVHLAATYDGSESQNGIQLYRNGVLLGGISRNTSGSYVGMANTGNNLDLGGTFGGASMQGALDDIRLYTEVLAAQKVRAIFTNSRQGYPELLNRLPLGGYRSPSLAAARNKAKIF